MRDDTAPKVIDLMAALRDSLRRERDNTTGGTGTMTGAERIAAERRRQIEVKGYTAAEDEEYIGGELSGAGAAYAELAFRQVADAPATEVTAKAILARAPLHTYQWHRWTWKPSEDPVRNLEKAGALIAAEIDRLLRERGEVPYSQRAVVQIEIDCCARCGGSHRVLDFKKLSQPMRTGHTHWASCPTTGEPIAMTFVGVRKHLGRLVP